MHTTTTSCRHLTDANLAHANLTNADLPHAKLMGADFTDADLTGAWWPTETAVPDGWTADLGR